MSFARSDIRDLHIANTHWDDLGTVIFFFFYWKLHVDDTWNRWWWCTDAPQWGKALWCFSNNGSTCAFCSILLVIIHSLERIMPFFCVEIWKSYARKIHRMRRFVVIPPKSTWSFTTWASIWKWVVFGVHALRIEPSLKWNHSLVPPVIWCSIQWLSAVFRSMKTPTSECDFFLFFSTLQLFVLNRTEHNMQSGCFSINSFRIGNTVRELISRKISHEKQNYIFHFWGNERFRS